MPPDREPDQVLVDETKTLVLRLLRRVQEAARTWVTVKLAGILFAGAAVIYAAIDSQPWVAAIGCAIVTATALAWAVAAQHLMHGERARRRWQEVGLLRSHIEVLELQRALDVVALALSGDREARTQINRIKRPDVAAALRFQEHRIREAVQAAKPPQSAQARARSPLPKASPPPDLKALQARKAQHEAELAEAKASVQALADTSDKPARDEERVLSEQARAARRAAMDADKVARERRRRGQDPTPAGSEAAFLLTLDAAGNQQVQRQEPPLAPEQISPPREAKPPDTDE